MRKAIAMTMCFASSWFFSTSHTTILVDAEPQFINLMNLKNPLFIKPHVDNYKYLNSVFKAMEPLGRQKQHEIFQIIEGSYFQYDYLQLEIALNIAYFTFQNQLKLSLLDELTALAEQHTKILLQQEAEIKAVIEECCKIVYELVLIAGKKHTERNNQSAIRVWCCTILGIIAKGKLALPATMFFGMYELVQWLKNKGF